MKNETTEVNNPGDADQVNLLSISDAEIWLKKAELCQVLYDRGLEYPPWTDERAKWHYKSLVFFVEEFIKPRFAIPEFHKQWYWWIVREKNYMNLAPRDHAKTSVHSVYRTIWEICVNRNIRYFIVFATQDIARLALSEIKSHLVQNSRIRAGFGIFNPMELSPDQRLVDPNWTHDSITVNRSDYSLKDPTVGVAGATSKVLSRRADRLIADDMVDDQTAYSAADTERLERWWGSDIEPVLVADGQEIITGTRYKTGDFYDSINSKSIENGGMYRVFIGDAIIDEATKQVLWPERWSWKSLLEQRAKMGRLRFNRNYRNIIMDDATSVFPMIWFTGGVGEDGVLYRGCYDESLVLGSPKRGAGKNWLRYSVLGVDPAIGQSGTSKFFAAVLLGITYDNTVVIADIVRGQFGFVAQKRIVIGLYEKWRPRHVSVESNAYQMALVDGIEEQYKGMPIAAIYTSAAAGSKPDIGVPAMDIWFETGRIRIPRGDQRSVEITDLMVEELHHWGKHITSDIVMALWFAFKKALPELTRSSILPNVENLIFGDRRAREQRLLQGVSGAYVPSDILSRVRQSAMEAPLSHLSPLRKIGLSDRPITRTDEHEIIH